MSNKNLLLTLLFALFVFVALVAYQASPLARQVTLRAQSWNNGVVHLWQNIIESEATYTDLPDGTRCRRLDSQMHPLVGSPPLIYYYRVNCNGSIGYVEVDQVR